MKGSIVRPSEDLSLRRVIMGLQLEGHGGEHGPAGSGEERERTGVGKTHATEKVGSKAQAKL